jgi:hypothetical protein
MRPYRKLSGVVLCIACSACCEQGIRTVELYVTSDGAYASYLWPADTVTLVAAAGTDGREFCYHKVYTAVDLPDRFTYQLTDTLVANVTGHGVLHARSSGFTYISARSHGIQSAQMIVVVAPPVATLRLSGVPPTLTVGDTINVGVEALDSLGQTVQGAQINFDLIRLRRLRDSVAAFVSAPLSVLPYESVSAPLTLRLRAMRAGDDTLVVEVPHDIARRSRPVASVAVHVVSKVGT